MGFYLAVAGCVSNDLFREAGSKLSFCSDGEFIDGESRLHPSRPLVSGARSGAGLRFHGEPRTLSVCPVM